MVYSILSEARVRHSVAPKQPDTVQYQVVWDTNQDLKDWTTFVNMDIVGAWGGFLYGTKRTSSGGFIGPSSDFPAVDALVNDRIFFRMKYDRHPKSQGPTTFGKIQWTTTSDPLFDDFKSITFDLIADGRWQFYEINMGEADSWVGDVVRVRFFPCEDGWFNDEFFLGFFEIGTNVFDFDFEEDKAGSPGFAEASIPLNQSITIEQGINDKLLVNIDGYGDVQITLSPQTSQPFLIARDVSLQLAKVGVGGYIRSDCFLTDDSRLRIESGTRAADSSVIVKDGSSSAAHTLGFTDLVGFFIGTTGTGSPPDANYEPLSAYRPTTLEIFSLFDNDDDVPAFSLNPQTPIVQGGNINYAVTNQLLRQEVAEEGRATGLQGFNIVQTGALSATARTFIDLNHPFSDEGKVDKIFMNGIPNRDGSSKWKIFRPRLNGTLTLVAEGPIAEKTFTDNPSGGLVSSSIPDVFSEDISTQDVRVRRGDLLGIYNVGLHAGQGSSIKPDALYYSISGDAQGTITPPPPSGAGETGLPIYAQGFLTKNRAVVDIDLRRRLNIDRVRVMGIEDTRDLEYNVATSTSAIFNADTPGSHTICYIINPTFGIRDCFTRQNQGFNIQALNDGMRHAENGDIGFGDAGVGGLGGADVGGSTYFYVNGDGEFLEQFEFPTRAPRRYGFFRDPIGLECFFSNQFPRLDKPIGRVSMYFKDRKNQRSWQLEFLEGQGGKGGNGSKPGFSIIPPASLRSVQMDNRLIEAFGGVAIKQGHMSLLLDNPVVLDVIAADGTVNPQVGVDFQENVGELGGANFRDQATFLEFQWSRFDWNFDAIRTPAIRWFSNFHWSTKISEMEIYAVSSSNESLGDNVQVLFSADGQSFTTAELVNANEKEAEYKIGNSPQFMRLIIRPTLQTSLSDIKIDFEEDQVCFGEEGRIVGATALNEARVGTTGASTPLLITNNTGQTADLIIDVPEDIETAKQLLYFNQLNSAEDIQRPQVGPPARVDFNDDKVLREERSVSINATAYGLLSLASGTKNFISPELGVNSGFETGTAEGWNVNITNSGTLPFQIPRVDDFTDFPGASDIQIGNYCFGVVQDLEILPQLEQFAQVTFDIGQTHDVSAFASAIDSGAALFQFSLQYAHYGTGPVPLIRIMGSPTLSGVLESPGTVVDSNFGSNLLSSFSSRSSQSVSNAEAGNIKPYNGEVNIKAGTRYIRTQININLTGAEFGGSAGRLTFLMDNYSAKVAAADISAVRWYKSYLTGTGDFTDTSFVPVDPGLIVAVTGSNHWYQPARQVAGLTPIAGQSQGFNQVFAQDRNQGIQSFARMTSTNPGILGMRWEGEKKIAGIRIAHADAIASSSFFNQHYPRFWDIEVLKTQAELGGLNPDLNNPEHWQPVRRIRGTVIREQSPARLTTNSASFGGSRSKITTWIFEEPVFTEGVRIVYLLNCDAFERNTYPNFTSFTNITGCPRNNNLSVEFNSTSGLYVSMFTALESVGRTSLPADNVPDRQLTPGVSPETGAGGTVYTAVDLGRPFDIDTNSDLFELVSKTLTQSPWPGTALFSGDSTDDPNQVTWAGSSSFARWVRFSSPSSDAAEWEKEVVGTSTGANETGSPYQVLALPQGILVQARIYPRLQTATIPTEGPNHFWADLGKILTDNRSTTLVNYSDYPVICLDLGRPYTLLQTAATTLLRRDLVTPGTTGGSSGDKNYWQRDNDNAFAYSSKAFQSTDNPSSVTYTSFGTATPSTAVRWLAIKGIGNLLRTGASNTPKLYNFQTQGGSLTEARFAPANPPVFTENSNWFVTSTSALRDISTIETTLGLPFSAAEDVDYGSNGPSSQNGTFGDPYFVWDGRFSIEEDDFWGIGLLDPNNGLIIGGNDFPHYVWRVFRDLHRGNIVTKTVKAITILGYDTEFYPTDFQIQSLINPAFDPTLDTSWSTISQGIFTGVNTFNEGFGFTYILPATIETTGIRIYITDSVYPDFDEIQTVNELGQFRQGAISRGPQTRVASITIYEEVIEEASLQGFIETDHARDATVTSLTQVPERSPGNLVDGDSRTFWQATGFEDVITITLDSPRTINRVEWEMNEALANQLGLDPISTNAPATFRLKTNASTVLETALEIQDYTGLTFSGTLFPPVLADTFVLEIDEPQGINAGASSIIMHSLRLIETVDQSTPLVTIEDVFDRHPGSLNLRSTKVTYAANTAAIANVYLDGIDANNDELFSERDFFTFWIRINDVSLLDTSFGSIRLGNNREVFYSWDISDRTWSSGWNEVRLQFKEASDRSEIPFQSGPNFDPDTGESQVDFITPDIVITSSVDGTFSRRIEEAPGIRFFGLEFRGRNSSQELELILDDMQFVRNRFDDVCRFTPSLYLNNSETMTIYLEGLDLSTGTVEFWLQPDWDIVARLDRLRNIIPSIFKVTRPDGKFLTFFYRPGNGFTAIINAGDEILQFQSKVSKYEFERFETMHVALAWDVFGRMPPTGATLRMWVNGEIVYGTNRTWNGLREGGTAVMFGGEVGQAVAATPHNNTAITFTAVPTLPQNNTASAWALLENIKIYNYAKTNFSDINQRDLVRTQLIKPSEMLQISLDDVNFYSSGADQLPLVVENVPAGEGAVIYMRSNIPRGITKDESRDASLLVRWKSPLINCN